MSIDLTPRLVDYSVSSHFALSHFAVSHFAVSHFPGLGFG